ncbi:hypothetical protein BJ912DRAFT_1147038 [Pholiota molesta]|nr:hypothetical protein BJ912DRAFT_1147038 [Pholiota molesta]
MSLPYDIFDDIVDIIRQRGQTGDFRTLYTMSITCRSMLQLCRKYLFYEMTLQPRNMDDVSHIASNRKFRLRSLKPNPTVFRLKIVKRLVESSPDILKNVRRLFFESHPSNYNDTALISLMSKFDNLNFLSIATHESIDNDILHFFQPNHSWNSLPQSYQLALVQLIRRSPLHELAFDDYGDIPSDILLPVASLINLSLCRTTFSSSNLISPSISIFNKPTRPLMLKELWTKYHLADIAPLLSQHPTYGHSIIDPAALKSLNFELRNVDNAAWDDWDHNMLKNISNLECLFFSNPLSSYQNFLNDFLNGLHPHSITTLNFLRYSINYDYFIPQSQRHPKPLPSAVIGDLKFVSLETLEIYVHIDSEYELRVLEDFFELDKIIGGPDFPSLKSLTIAVSYISPSRLSYFDQWPLVPASRFNRVSSNPFIEFNYFFV